MFDQLKHRVMSQQQKVAKGYSYIHLNFSDPLSESAKHAFLQTASSLGRKITATYSPELDKKTHLGLSIQRL